MASFHHQMKTGDSQLEQYHNSLHISKGSTEVLDRVRFIVESTG